MAAEPTLASLAALASTSAALGEDAWADPSSSLRTKEQVRRHYVRQLHKVIDESDIVVLVLDARDPDGCRSRLVEEEVRRKESEGKRLVFVLNKIDLVPRDNAEQWLRHLRHSAPTLPFRSATSNQRSNLSSTTAPALLRLLKAYKPSAKSVTVGIVGFPNVGKSSLINSLKRSKVCSVAAQPGHTKDLQSIQLERGIRIIDSPGVVFDDDTDTKSAQKTSILLRNVVKVEDVDDPIAVVEEILARTAEETVQKIYNVPQFSSTIEFLTMLALSSGRLLKGGTPDVLAAARHVLMDWNHQKIPYMSTPPVVHPSLVPATMAGSETVAPGAEATGQAQILNELSKPFELAGFFGAADAGAFGGDAADQEMEEDGGFVPDQEEQMAEDVVDDGLVLPEDSTFEESD
ncbi:P-loop containing nucleoside triphosphate hydrolase protein [Coniophora puteana RWD-64-598 SS2]|uniref:P-loop containing nucleoside triphosphate hydrolase protein n=1 Tax=Coniophora puteana (strain RWD-64-598) TaxID=741705 RepID=A0A5M3MF20_CONPW|nr:P-loop containing nucleoside triphosphate hydrolase protein [Coniophora puteana RWD-64-598 SS2]EIW77743.1 P-loop containing nucleoside triphosphate hydrolase protein [Coniophora puteana RWD-64-598 SS2]